MIKQQGKYLSFIIGFITCFFSICYAQEPVVKTSLDNNKILIGQQFKLTVELDFSSDDYDVHWLKVPDSMQHFEVISKTDIDSAYENDKLASITQVFTLTSFDSGEWALPVFMVNLKSKKIDSTVSLFTDSLPVNVSYSPLDTTNHFKEIKPIIEVHNSRPFWQYIAGGVLVLLLIIGLIWLYRYYKKKKPQAKTITSNLSAYQQAMNGLDELKKNALATPAEIKLFHSKLSDIFRTYLSAKENTDYRNKTTSDILLSLNDIDKVKLSQLAAALRCGDAVKFAKYIPPKEENLNCLSSVKNIIELLDKKNV